MPLSIDRLISARRLILRLLLIFLLLALRLTLACLAALAGAVAAFAGDGAAAAGVLAKGAGAGAVTAGVGAWAGADGVVFGTVAAAGAAGVGGAPVFAELCASATPGTHKRKATADRQEMVRIEKLPICTQKAWTIFCSNLDFLQQSYCNRSGRGSDPAPARRLAMQAHCRRANCEQDHCQVHCAVGWITGLGSPASARPRAVSLRGRAPDFDRASSIRAQRGSLLDRPVTDMDLSKEPAKSRFSPALQRSKEINRR